MKMPMRIHDVHFHRRQIGMLAVLLSGIVGCKKAGASDNSMESGKSE
jgi:hypothetical protein